MSETANPNYFLIDQTDPAALENHLKGLGWIPGTASVDAVSKAGEGNMNCTLRVIIDGKSVIIKQSRPWVEKYPAIAAPEERIVVECRFYRTVENVAGVADRMPKLLQFDEASRLAMFEDLGMSSDYSSLYKQSGKAADILPGLCDWLSALHAVELDDETRAALLNRSMRQLNHEHLYHFPLLENNGFPLDDITPGLQAVGDRLKGDTAYVRAVEELGQLYLADGETILHGDFFPGSWLEHPAGVKIIDPEFCFPGPAEYDLGILMGHLLMCGESAGIAKVVFGHYKDGNRIDQDLTMRFAAMEIMRRLIGVAQLPLDIDLQRKAELLDISRSLMLDA